MTNERLEEVALRANAATPGPWNVEPHGMTDALYAGRTDEHHGLRLMNLDDWDSNGDANVDFITHAREDIPALIAEVRWLRWLVERVASLTADEIAEREQVEQLIADARALLATEEVCKR